MASEESTSAMNETYRSDGWSAPRLSARDNSGNGSARTCLDATTTASQQD